MSRFTLLTLRSILCGTLLVRGTIAPAAPPGTEAEPQDAATTELRESFLKMCDLAVIEFHKEITTFSDRENADPTTHHMPFFEDAHGVRTLAVAYDMTGDRKYLDACKHWCDRIIAFQRKMIPEGAYYMNHSRAPGEDHGQWNVADSGSIGMGVLATAVRCSDPADKQRYLASVKAFADLVIRNYVGPEGGITNGCWPGYAGQWWCSSATAGCLLFLLYEETGEEQYLEAARGALDWLLGQDFRDVRPITFEQRPSGVVFYCFEFYATGLPYLEPGTDSRRRAEAQIAEAVRWVCRNRPADQDPAKPFPMGTDTAALPYLISAFARQLPEHAPLRSSVDEDLRSIATRLFGGGDPQVSHLLVWEVMTWGMLSFAERLSPGTLTRSSDPRPAEAQAKPAPGEDLAALRRARREAAHRKRRMIFNNDGDDVIYTRKEPTAEALLALRTSPLVGSQVDSIFYSNSLCFGDALHQSKVFEPFLCTDYIFKDNGLPQLLERGIDPIRVMTDFGREHGIEVFWDMRMNDTHDAMIGGYGPYLRPKLKLDHPEYLVGAADKQPRHGTWSSVNYAVPEIRELAYRFFEEVCQEFDVDGIELDFFRHACFFKSVADGGRNVPVLTPSDPWVVPSDKTCEIELLIGEDLAWAEEAGLEPRATCHVQATGPDVVVSLNGQPLEKPSLEGDWLDFPVPTSLLKQGANRLSVSAPRAQPSPDGADEWTLVWDGSQLPAHPWRKMGFAQDCVAEIRDGGLLLADRGKSGGTYAYFQNLSAIQPDAETVVEARVKLLSGWSSVLVENGLNGEEIMFLPDQLKIRHCGLSCPTVTTDTFHTYRIVIHRQDLRVYVDGKLRLDAAGRFTHPAPNGRSGVAFGGANSPSVGEAIWTSVKIRNPTISLLDVALSIKFPGGAAE